jgi:hypothetical protein
VPSLPGMQCDHVGCEMVSMLGEDVIIIKIKPVSNLLYTVVPIIPFVVSGLLRSLHSPGDF